MEGGKKMLKKTIYFYDIEDLLDFLEKISNQCPMFSVEADEYKSKK